ncbi:hypothetical protein TRIUR3_30799 [Triticum urartu]|uniref:Uncharacterized protein n=1 Tax=Triticum urartu TaxID=4572 RepID=M7Y4B3_TRIUA|nr:hypothetical protein TRIUR3_30799 [Triticum urartu]
MTVLVLAQVRFKVGLAYSRQYDVQVSCQPVDFFAATAAAAATRVDFENYRIKLSWTKKPGKVALQVDRSARNNEHDSYT